MMTHLRDRIKEFARIPVAKLRANPRNWRTHPEAQRKALRGMLNEIGFSSAVIARELPDGSYELIDGHLRLESMGPNDKVPTLILDVDEGEADKLLLTLDPLAAMAGTDKEMLAGLFESTSFDDDALASLIADTTGYEFDIDDDDQDGEDAEPQIDKAEELRAKWGVERGHLWRLGEHLLLCGDSTSADDVEHLMDGHRAGICFTSPPYAQQREYRDAATEKVSDWDALMRGVFGNVPLADDGQLLVNLGLVHRDGEWWPYWDGWIEWMRENGWKRFGWYVWDQGFGLPGDWNGRFGPSHEFVFHFNRSAQRPEKTLAKKPENIKKRSKGASTMRGKDGVCREFTSPEASAQPRKIPDSVIRVNRMHGGHNIAHPAVFPVGLSELVIEAWPGIAYEPFSGSGTTLIACENLGRKCRAIEISPAYVAVAIQRWADHTGGSPELVR